MNVINDIIDTGCSLVVSYFYVLFIFRLSLLEEWRGVRDAELSEKSGIPGCIFVHAAGFIGGNATYEGALEMAKRTLQARTKIDE